MSAAQRAPLRQQIWAWLLPPERFSRSDGMAYQRAAATVLLAAGGASIMGMLAFGEFCFDLRMLALPPSIAAIGALALLIPFRRGTRQSFHRNAICALLFGAVFVLAWWTQGRLVSPIIILPFLVFLSVLALERGEAMAWAAVAMGTALASFILTQRGEHPTLTPLPAWVATAPYRSAIVLGVFAILIASMLMSAYREQQARMAELSEMERQRQSDLDAERQRFRDFAAVAADGFWETDADHRLTYVSPGYAEMFGLAEEQMLGRTPIEIAQSLDPKRTISPDKMGAMVRHEAFSNQRLLARGARGTLVLSNSARPMFGVDGRFSGFRGAVVDISETHRLTKELRRLAESDPLTGLANRRCLHQMLESQLQQEPPGWLLCMDLDHFKEVNDAHGHKAGDRLLIEVARILQNAVRGEDLVARMGGDEFAVVLVGGNQLGAELVAARILKGLAELATQQPDFRNVSASIGLSTLTGVEDVDTALIYADGACYLAKRSGRGRYMLAGD